MDLLLALETVETDKILYVSLPVSTARLTDLNRIDSRLPVNLHVDGAGGEHSLLYELLPFIRARPNKNQYIITRRMPGGRQTCRLPGNTRQTGSRPA